jgi:hypothetical protein
VWIFGGVFTGTLAPVDGPLAGALLPPVVPVPDSALAAVEPASIAMLAIPANMPSILIAVLPVILMVSSAYGVS